MLKNKSAKHIEINSEDLFKITIKILDNIVVEPNLHHILFICYLTVKEFSRNNQHLDQNAKIELSIKYAVDLIDGLGKSNVIKQYDADNIKNEVLTKEEEVRSILEVYAMIFIYKNEDPISSSKCCLH
jgi:hypothetical protein